MAQKTVILTVCDRCGHEERTSKPSKAYVTEADTKKSGVTWELCESCRVLLERFLHMEGPEN